MSKILETVRTWDPIDQERFIEKSGMQMNDGLPQDRADQVAFLQVAKSRRQRLNDT